MRPIGITPEILISIVWIGIVCDSLSYPELNVSLEQIKVIVEVETEIISKSTGLHVLIHEGKTGIWVIVFGLPIFMAKPLSVEGQNKACWVLPNEMGDIRIMQEDRTVKRTKINVAFLWYLLYLGVAYEGR